MPRMIFINLPVTDLAKSMAFYEAVGAVNNPAFTDDTANLNAAAGALANAVHTGVLGKLTVAKIDGADVLGSDHALADALAAAGFRLTPQGLRLRR